MIFHELCHSLVEGPDSFRRPDWGLDNTGPRDEVREHACLRVQAHLCQRFGLSSLLAPTTDYRAYWDQLPGDPLAPRRDPATTAAILGLQRVARPPWGPHLERALEATAVIARQAAAFVEADDDDDGDTGTSLYMGAGPAPAPHPAGLPATARAEAGQCGDLRLARFRWRLPASRWRRGRPGLAGLRPVRAALRLPGLRRLLPGRLSLGHDRSRRPGDRAPPRAGGGARDLRRDPPGRRSLRGAGRRHRTRASRTRARSTRTARARAASSSSAATTA